ncbi:MAG: DNA replication/repair protein RecF [Geminicoccaceae bacterium]|nr:DNA replication/repair protein RecF [Geminicoccaceae bacterium]MCX8100001.1 DNA replication/repair protein RecF [Geminicoccaceae bacterium]MDW8369791.1 DNA replication/repair protein RecF [Geminicoccaceae bacterium]
MAAALAVEACARPIALAVERLRLKDVRNYARLALELPPGPVVLTGPNGAGKTNLLEALSLLAPGRGLRRAELAAIDRRPEGGPWAISARLRGRQGPFELAVARDPEQDRRLVTLDGRPQRDRGRLAELVPMVWLSPAQDRLFQEGPAERRRFLDRLTLAFDPRHAALVATHERLLRDRAVLLRGGPRDPAWLAALEARIAAVAVAIAAARRELVAALERCRGFASEGLPEPVLALEGEVEGWLETAPAAAVEERLAAALRASRARDAETGGAAHGPHRSDLLVFDRASGTPAAACSTGRQKALLASLVLRHARLVAELRGELPLLLLDEVCAHLDSVRRRALAEALLALGAQAWLTGTEPELFAGLLGRATFLSVDNGTIRADERHDPA